MYIFCVFPNKFSFQVLCNTSKLCYVTNDVFYILSLVWREDTYQTVKWMEVCAIFHYTFFMIILLYIQSLESVEVLMIMFFISA